MEPMKAAFEKGEREAGLRTFMGCVLDNPQAWDKMSDSDRQDIPRHAHEWDVMMTTGELFPDLDPQVVRKIAVPTLLLSGEKAYGFLALIDEELVCLLPHSRRIILRDATHGMWFEQPDVCRKAVLDFWRGLPELRKAVHCVSASELLRAMVGYSEVIVEPVLPEAVRLTLSAHHL